MLLTPFVFIPSLSRIILIKGKIYRIKITKRLILEFFTYQKIRNRMVSLLLTIRVQKNWLLYYLFPSNNSHLINTYQYLFKFPYLSLTHIYIFYLFWL